MIILPLVIAIVTVITVDYNVNFLRVNKEMNAYAERLIDDVGLPPVGKIERMIPINNINNPCSRNPYYRFLLTPVTCKDLGEQSIAGFCLHGGRDFGLIIEVSTKYGYGTATFRQILIHELAHCLYNVRHTEEGGPEGIMRATLNIKLTKKEVDKLERDLILYIRQHYNVLKGENL